MPGSSTVIVSANGVLILPPVLCARWGVDQGGEVGIIDLGGAALVVPGGLQVAQRELHRVLREGFEVGLSMGTDADLLDQ